MTQFVAGLRRLREALSCSVVIIHHTGISNTERERGSGALRGAADVLIRVRKMRGGSGCLSFEVLPGRDIEPMEAPLALRLRRVETDWCDDDGNRLATCIVEAGDQPIASTEHKARPLEGAQSAVLTIARDLAAAEVPDPSGWVGISRRQITCRAKLRGISRQSVSPALRSLEGHGCIRLTEVEKVLVRAES